MKKIFVSCFDIGEVPRSPGKWNWNWLYFLPLIFTLEQGALYDIITHLFATKRNMWHIQKPASRMYSTVLQSNPYILGVLRCHSINLVRVSCHFGSRWMLKLVEMILLLFLGCDQVLHLQAILKLYFFWVEHPLCIDCSW